MRRRSASPLAFAPLGELLMNLTANIPSKTLRALASTLGVDRDQLFIGVRLRGAPARRALKRIDDACAEAIAREPTLQTRSRR